MDKLAQDIILKPIVSEKSMAATADKKYSFAVDKKANKIEIARAVEKLFDVKVDKVNTINVRGHLRRYGRFEGYKPSWKKAVVTLTKESKTIEFFDGMF